ncbi:MAG: hypothetical protein HY074_02470 [Deltaproteobacteria bacterium]|nr:hypothetical protein [Deltaproteobacteria bacterium]
MRAYAFAAGLICFATIAMGGEDVLMQTRTYKYEGEYLYAPGTSDQATVGLSVTRKFKFLMLDSKPDEQDTSKLALEKDSTIREYLAEDISGAIAEARQKARASRKNVQDFLPKLLANLPFKNVDCRMVARSMVEHLITNRVQLDKNSDGSLTHRYQTREDQLDMVMMAKQLDQISISRDSKITTTDQEPHFTCRRTSMSDGPAKCGDLRIKYNPLEAQSGVFKGKKAVVFDEQACDKKLDETDRRSCELHVQVQRCGMKFSQKAEGKRAGMASTRGLSDELEANMNDEIRARQDGRYQLSNGAVGTDQNGEPMQKTDSFRDEFTRGGVGSKQPID